MNWALTVKPRIVFRLLALTFLLLAGAGFRRAYGASAVSSRLAQIEQQTSQLRGLTPIHTVRVLFLSSSAFVRVLQSEMMRGYDPGNTQVSQQEYQLMGLLPRNASLKHLLFDGLTGQAIGFYSPSRQALYIRGTSGNALTIQRDTIVHEYTHALQDQHFNLRRLEPIERGVRYRNSDALSAHQALVEGDAVNTQSRYIQRYYSRADLAALAHLDSQETGPSVPPGLQKQFDFPYVTGTAFVQSLYARGGNQLVDRSLVHPPDSTYQIMYPGAYLQGWQPVNLTFHGVVFSNWRAVDDDVLGAEGYQIWLSQFLGEPEVDRVVRRYRGDRYLFLQQSNNVALRLESIWTDSSACRSAQHASARAVAKRYGDGRVSGANPISVRSAAASVLLSCTGSRLHIAWSATPSLSARLLAAPLQ